MGPQTFEGERAQGCKRGNLGRKKGEGERRKNRESSVRESLWKGGKCCKDIIVKRTTGTRYWYGLPRPQKGLGRRDGKKKKCSNGFGKGESGTVET